MYLVQGDFYHAARKSHTQNGGCDSTTRILTLCFTNFRARKVYEDANQRLREDAIKANDEAQGKEFRVMLLENWRDFELENQDEESIKKVSNLMPKRVKKRRRIEQDEDAPGSLNPIFPLYIHNNNLITLFCKNVYSLNSL